MMDLPLVTIICLCYNHDKYVIKALESVLKEQSYPHIQLIVCDDASTDKSKEVIKSYIIGKDIQFIDNELNLGNCKTFNSALQYARGKYIIDLAADDYLLKETLLERVMHFESLYDTVGLTYSNAIYVNRLGREMYAFTDLNKLKTFPEGLVFKRLFEGRFICPPSVIFKTEVLKHLSGYDEALSFEDFDIWMRIAHQYEFAYTPTKSVAKRVLSGSLSSAMYQKQNTTHLESVLLICSKAIKLAESPSLPSIGRFALYHFRLSYFTGNFEMAHQFYKFANKIVDIDFKHRFLRFLLDKKINIYLLYKLYLKIKLRDTKLS